MELQNINGEDVYVVWKPIKDSSQEVALSSPCSHTLYHGTRGPGKTVTQLMRFRKRVGLGYGSFWRGIAFDREFKHLADMVAQSKRFFPLFEDGAKFLESASEYKWVWPTGEELLFRHIKKLSDYNSYHGHEYPYISWNELTKWPTIELYEKLMSTNRSSFVPEIHTPKDERGNYLTHDGKPLCPIPLEVFSTTNPSGSGHNWVKRLFINSASNGEIITREVDVFNPRTKQNETVKRTQVAIFGSYRENIYLDTQYIAELDLLTRSDPNLRSAWLFGSWDVTSGGALDDLWKKDVHILQRFPIPKDWKVRLDRAFDWGSSQPFYVCWFVESNGEDVTLPTGEVRNFPRGTLIMFAEWYGTREIGTNLGIKMSAKGVALGIREREIELMANGWIYEQPQSGPADNSIRDVREDDVDTIEMKMAKEGIRWTKSDKSPGSRKNGLQLIRDRLEASITGEGPGLYFMSNCVAAIETIPVLPRDENNTEDVDSDSEDHPYDALRYRVLKSSNRFASKINATFVH
jgi:hypothetical protein